MLYIFELFFYILFLFSRLYSLIDKSYILSDSGSKLNKYIKIKNRQNIINSFTLSNINNYNIHSFISKAFKSQKWCKQFIFIMLVSTAIITLKISITYNFLISNFFYITIFNKYIILNQILGDYFYIFKLSYYLFSYLFIIYIVYSILNNIYTNKENKLNISELNKNSINLFIGKDQKQNIIHINEKGLYQNILITGSIGSGKTSSAISVILDGLIKNNLGGLVIDVKGNFYSEAFKIAKKYNREQDIYLISIDKGNGYNPLDYNELSSVELSNRIINVLKLISDSNNSDPYWLDKAEGYIRDMISIIRVYNNITNFEEIHKLVTSKEYLIEKIEEVKEKILNNFFSDEELFELNSALFNLKQEYMNLDERTSNIIRSEITRMTSIFLSNLKFYQKFCLKNNVINFPSEKIVILSIGIGENKIISKIISTYLKLDFQKQIISQLGNYKKSFFICDEYQEIANSEDMSFFSLSREYMCVNVISMQSYSSLLNTLKSEVTTKVIIQNFVNKIWFRNDDIYTISETIKFIGKYLRDNESITFSENSKVSNYSMLFRNFKSRNSNISESRSISKKNEYLLSEEDFSQNLNIFEAIAMLSDGTKSIFYRKIRLYRLEDDI